MKLYYEIESNYSYLEFSNWAIQMKPSSVVYVKQFDLANKIILYIGDEKITELPNIINVQPLKYQRKRKKTFNSKVCCSIRLENLNLSDSPYEYIAKKICNFLYPLNEAILHTDQYGIQRIICI